MSVHETYATAVRRIVRAAKAFASARRSVAVALDMASWDCVLDDESRSREESDVGA